MLDLIFPFIYFLGLIASGMMRTQQRRQNKRNQIAISHATKLDLMLMGLSSVGMIILPLIYVATPWVKFADYHLHSLVGLIGIAIYVSGLWLLSKSHADLDRNWMPTVELREGHSLVTQGVFAIYGTRCMLRIGYGLLLNLCYYRTGLQDLACW